MQYLAFLADTTQAERLEKSGGSLGRVSLKGHLNARILWYVSQVDALPECAMPNDSWVVEGGEEWEGR